MTLSHEETNARLLELVYGEAPPLERVALEAHVATCARCQTELAAMGDTRARPREALDDVPVPARAHARILEAAARAVAPVAAQAAPLSVAARARTVAAAPSFWARLRGKWTFPTFATVGAIAVVLFASKVFLDPARTVERGREALAPEAPPVATSASRAAPGQPPADEPRAKSDLPASANAAAASAAAVGQAARPPSEIGDLAKERARGFGPGRVAGPFGGGLTSKRIANAVSRSHGDIGGLMGGSGGYASPPSGWKGGAPAAPASASAPASAPAPVATAAHAEGAAAPEPAPRRMRKESSDNPLDELGASGAPREAEEKAPAGADKASAKPAPAKPKAEMAFEDADDGRAGAADRQDRPAAKKSAAPAKALAKDAKATDGGPSQETLARRAEQLYAARRWSEAIAAYRELLRRFPDADLKTRWRARITQAETESGADAAAVAAQRQAATKASAKAKQTPAAATPVEAE